MKFQSCKTVLLNMQCMKKLWISLINVYNVKYILPGTCFCSNSIKIENQAVPTEKVTKKEESINFNPEESSKVKNLVFPVSLRLWKFKQPVADIRSTNLRAFLIFRKVNGIVKANSNSVKTLLNMFIIDSKEKQQKLINTWTNKNIFLKC